MGVGVGAARAVVARAARESAARDLVNIVEV